MAPLAEIQWSRPLGLVALALPVAVLLLARLRTRPPAVATGTFALWRGLAERDPRAARSHRPRTPLSTWLAALALLAGALALGGPRVERAAGARTWTAVLDLAPATGVAWTAADGFAPAGAPTRLERAVEAARAWLAAEARAGDRVRWDGGAGGERSTAPGEAPDAAWLAEARARAERSAGGAARPSPAAYDRAGVLLCTDRAPEPAPEAAGWFASGGGAVHGAVAADREGLWLWDGAGLEPRPYGDEERASLALDATAAPLPASLADLAATWAAVRGVRVLHGARDARLVLRAAAGAAGAEEREVDVGRDGWRALVRHPAGGLGPGGAAAGAVWLAAPDGSALIRARPGLVEVAARALEPRGDPALFAVSVGSLLDAALPAHPAVAPLAARAAAGEPSMRAPLPPPEERARDARETRLPLDAWLAGAAAVLGLLSLAVLRLG